MFALTWLMLVLYATGRIVLSATLAVSPWVVCLRLDVDQSISDCISHGGPK